MRQMAMQRFAAQRRRMRVFYTFTYFDVREPIRLLLVDNAIYFDEVRIDDLSEWSQIKHRFAFNQLPCLQDDDVKIVQTGAIMRHLARKHDLYGRNEEERVFLDVFYDCLRDVHTAYLRLINVEEDYYIEKTAPQMWAKFEDLLKDREGPLLLGDKASFVDYALFEELDIHLIMSPRIFDHYPKLKVFHQRFNERPNLQKAVLCLLALVAVCLADRHHHRRTSSRDEAPQPPMRVSTLEAFRDRVISKEAEELQGDALIDYINSHQTLWKAKKTRMANYGRGMKWGLMGVEHVHLSVKAKKHLSDTRFSNVFIPENFDSRTQWPKCDSIKQIRDQSACGSCWAFGAVEAMSDRICIASGQKIQVSLSADDLLSCCGSCGFGCEGGDPLAAWRYWVKSGIVTGSNFTLQQGCKPYPFPPCEHHSNKTHYDPCKHDLYPTPKCEKKCVEGYTTRTYNEDKYYGKSAYGVEAKVESIQKEILTNGPVEVAFEVYEDFVTYESGIYVHSGGKLDGGHAVKLIGWGIENGTPYWTVANSWNTDWGEDGFFRILRGVDECGIESGAVGGVPKLNTIPLRRVADDDDF